MRRTFVGVLLVLLAVAPSAAAHTQTTLDPDDSPGPLDLVAQQLRHGKARVSLRAVTYEEWDDALGEDSENAIWFHLNLDDDGQTERCIRHPSAASGAAAEVYRRCSFLPFAEPVGTIESVTRPDSHSLVIRVPKELLWKRMPSSFQWQALTSYEAEGDPNCPPPEHLPPEHFYGTCTDYSDWTVHKR